MQISAIKSLRFIFAHGTFYCATAMTVTGVICPYFVAGEREKGKETERVCQPQALFPITGVLRSIFEI